MSFESVTTVHQLLKQLLLQAADLAPQQQSAQGVVEAPQEHSAHLVVGQQASSNRLYSCDVLCHAVLVADLARRHARCLLALCPSAHLRDGPSHSGMTISSYKLVTRLREACRQPLTARVCTHHLARLEDERSRLGVADAHDDRCKPLRQDTVA